MIIRKHILKTAIAVFLVIITAATLYINKFLAPGLIKDSIVKGLSSATGRPVSIKSVHLNPLRGFVIKDLALCEPDGKTEFIRIDRLTTSLLLIPLFTERKILIPSIRVLAPSVNIVKKQDGAWNFASPPLLKPAEAPSKPKTGFGILVQNVIIEKGALRFADNTRTPSYSRALSGIDGAAAYSPKENTIKFKAVARAAEPLKTTIGIDGLYLINENSAIAKASVKNLPLSEFYDYFYNLNLVANLKSGEADLAIDIKTEGGKKVGIACNSVIRDLDISYYDLNLKGDVGLAASSDIEFLETFKYDYRAQVMFNGADLKGLYFLSDLTSLTGAVEFTKDGISTTGLEAIAHNTGIKFIGGLKNMPDPQFRGTLRVDKLNLANLKDFFTEDLKSKFKDLEASGLAGAEIKLYKRFKDPAPLSAEGRIELANGSFKTLEAAGGLEKVSGDILFKNDAFYLSRLSFSRGPEAYLVDAKIENLKTPDIKMRLRSKDLLLDTRLRLPPESIEILRASGNYINSPFRATGTISDLKNPQVSLNGTIRLDLRDLRRLFPDISGTLEKFDIKGVFDLECLLKGPWKEFRNWDASVKGRSDRIGIWDLKLDTVNLDLRIRQNALLLNELSAKPYAGTFLATMEMDLSQPNPPYAINLAMAGIDLGRLITDTDLKGRTMSGTAAAKLALRGYGKNTETIKGEGSVLIKGSYLWEVPLLKGLASLLFLPNLSSIVFEEVSGDFVVKNRAITTGNFGFHSQGVSLLAEGGMGFDQNLDLMVTTSVSEDFVKNTSEFQRLTSLLFAKAGQLLGNIKITGTMKKPEYTFVPFAIDKVLPDKIKGLLGGFF